MFETTEELLQQVRAGEDSRLELKDLVYKGGRVAGPHRDSMADELAAMANTSSGVFLLGVDDGSKSITGIPEARLDLVENWVRDISCDLIEPELAFSLRKVPIVADDGAVRFIIRLDVPRSIHVHRSPGGYFHRVASAKRQLAPDSLARLFQQRSQARTICFDEQAVPHAAKDVLDSDLWAKFRTDLSPEDDQEFLAKLMLLTNAEDGSLCPSVTGILMASQEPRLFVTNAYIQAVAYRGTQRNAAYQLDALDLVGPLDEQIAQACHFVRKNMNVYAIKDLGRQDIPQYAMAAVFEAVVNAVAHRDYSVHASKVRLHLFSDRLEIFAPGSISNTLTVETIPFRQAARNELIVSMLARCPMILPEDYGIRRRFLMDKRGEGVPVILAASEQLSGRKPEYQLLDEAELMLTIYAAPPPVVGDIP